MSRFARRCLTWLLAFIGTAALLAAAAQAQETKPGDACSTAGLFRQSSGTDATTGGHFLFCNGANWLGFFRYTSDGDVGIGTDTPGSKLEVVGTMQADGLLLDAVSGNPPNVLSLGQLGDVDTSAADDAYVLTYDGDSGTWIAADSGGGGGDLWQLNGTDIYYDSGYVGIKNTSPDVELDVTGDIQYTGTIADVSDRRLKKDIENLSAGQLEKLIRLQGVSFKMHSDETGRTELGLIAQDVQAVYPELVSESGSGMLSLNYTGLIAPMIEAIKEQQAQIDELKAANNNLLARIEALEAAQQP